MAVHLITGYKGTEHIQSKDARSFNAAMFGSGEFVMEIGNQIEASIINNNTVRVLDGDILMQGGHIRIETDTYEDMTITTGTAGKNRNDLIVMTYEKNASDGTENAYLEVIKGTEVEGKATDPAYTSGNLAEGAIKNQMPLYRVKIEGVVLADIEALFTTIPTYKTLAEQYESQFRESCNSYLGSLNILDTKEEIEANTQPEQLTGALAAKEISAEISLLNENLTHKTNAISGTYDEGSFVTVDSIGYDKENKKLCLKVEGADAVIPFSGLSIELLRTFNGLGAGSSVSYEIPDDGIYVIIWAETWSDQVKYNGNYIKTASLEEKIMLANFNPNSGSGERTLQVFTAKLNTGDVFTCNFESNFGIMKLS